MTEKGKEKFVENCSTLSSFETRLPVTPLGRGVALVRVTDPPTAVVMEGVGERRMEAGSTEISPPTTVKLIRQAHVFCIFRPYQTLRFAYLESISLPSRVAESLDGLLFSTVQL